MEEEENKIKGGVIIMGSLFWENEKNCVAGKEKDSRARRRWRELNLDLSKKQNIRVPIRYGRFSGKENRENTYTMVLSREYLKRLGTALVVPFNRVFSIKEKGKIREQIKRLARVEGIQKGKEKVLAKNWSAVTIWINPKSNYFNEIRNYWQKHIIGSCFNYGYTGKNYEWSDGSLLDDSFQLQLPIETNFDFLLCTYILPKFKEGDDDRNRTINKNQGYPDVKTIGQAIADSGYSTYFCQNRVSEIVTTDDDKIFKHISIKK